MSERKGYERIVVVSGRDDESLMALRRAAMFQRAFDSEVRAIFLVPEDTPSARFPDPVWLSDWVARETALKLAPPDVHVVTQGRLAQALEQVAFATTDLVLCPAPGDLSSEIGSLSLRTLWARSVRLGASLLLVRRDVTPRRVLVASDGTLRSLGTLKLAFALAKHTGSALSFVDTMRIPLAYASELLPSPRVRHGQAMLQPASGAESLSDSASRVARRGSLLGPGPHLARTSARLRADLLVVGLAPSGGGDVEDMLGAAGCSVLAVPARPARGGGAGILPGSGA